ncbi:hypothetical protein BDR03DRAFT_962473 [Suillus americanus]|nr:hypothetical protein BDR03DRAFT_962473 [Suillus americanus]
MTARTPLVCPSNFWLGFIVDVPFVLVVGEDMLQNSNYRVQRHLSFHLSNSKIITYEDNNDRQIAGYNGRSCQVRVEFFASWLCSWSAQTLYNHIPLSFSL